MKFLAQSDWLGLRPLCSHRTVGHLGPLPNNNTMDRSTDGRFNTPDWRLNVHLRHITFTIIHQVQFTPAPMNAALLQRIVKNTMEQRRRYQERNIFGAQRNMKRDHIGGYHLKKIQWKLYPLSLKSKNMLDLNLSSLLLRQSEPRVEKCSSEALKRR